MLDASRILEICEPRSNPGNFDVDPDIPARKVVNAREKLRIPRDETVLALADFTLLGSNKNGLAITEAGIYWNGGIGKAGAGSFSWDELVGVELSAKNLMIKVGDKHNIWPVGIHTDALLEILAELKAEAEHPSAPAEEMQEPVLIPDGPFADLAELIATAASSLDAGKLTAGLHYHADFQIPERKRLAVIRRFGLPHDERLLGLFDLSEEADGEAGLAIGLRGIYWRNHSDVLGRSLAWAQLAVAEPAMDPANLRLIWIDARSTLFVPQWSKRGALLRFLTQTKEWARTHHAVLARAAAIPAVHASPPPLPGARRWMLAVGGNQSGPFDDATVEGMVRAGQLDPDGCLAWTEGMPQWLPFRQVPNLDILAASRAPMPPPLPPLPPPAGMTPPPPPGAGKRVIDF